SMMSMVLASFARNQDIDGHGNPPHDELAVKEDEVDQLQLDIVSLSVKLIALHQPVGADLRLLFMAPKIAEEFERVADHLVSMRRALHCDTHLADARFTVDIRIMGEVAHRM